MTARARGMLLVVVLLRSVLRFVGNVPGPDWGECRG